MTGTDKNMKEAIINNIKKISNINDKFKSSHEINFKDIIEDDDCVDFRNPDIDFLLMSDYIINPDSIYLRKFRYEDRDYNDCYYIETTIIIYIFAKNNNIIEINLNNEFFNNIINMEARIFKYKSNNTSYKKCILSKKAIKYFKKLFDVIEYERIKFKFNISCDDVNILFNNPIYEHYYRSSYDRKMEIDKSDFVKLLNCNLHITDENYENKLIVKNQNVTCQDLTKNIFDYLF